MAFGPILKGIGTWVPFLRRYYSQHTGGSISARYCYSVWLRHLCWLKKNRLSPCPTIVAELGPGDSIGVGLAALLCGAEQYWGFDAVRYNLPERDAEIFDELVILFSRKENIPSEEEFPKIRPSIDSCAFPEHVLTQDRLRGTLHPDRLRRLRKEIIHGGPSASMRYFSRPEISFSTHENSVDLFFSQAVLEHVDDLAGIYKFMAVLLKPGGIMSHEIDFSSHGQAREWNGHWAYPELIWRIIKGKRAYLLNRHPYSVHINLIRDNGFTIVCELKERMSSGISPHTLARHYRYLSPEDLTTKSAFIQAVKNARPDP